MDGRPTRSVLPVRMILRARLKLFRGHQAVITGKARSRHAGVISAEPEASLPIASLTSEFEFRLCFSYGLRHSRFPPRPLNRLWRLLKSCL